MARRVGNQSEFELLRATVTRDNQRPVNIARHGERDIAYLRLKQLLNLPLDAPLALTTPIDEPGTITRIIAANASTGPGAPFDAKTVDPEAPLPLPDTTTTDRAPVRQSLEAVRAQEGQLRVARADRLPTLALTSGYQRLFFPQSFLLSLNQFSENWSVGGQLTLSLFSGGRVSGNIEAARANLDEARARLQQATELAALDTRVALDSAAAGGGGFRREPRHGAAGGTRLLDRRDPLSRRESRRRPTSIRSRLQLQQATVNQALSARDLAVARARVALLRDLPLNTQSLGAAARVTQEQQLQQQQLQQQQQQQQQQQGSLTSTAANPSGASPSGSFPQ